MLSIPETSKIYLYHEPVDMRKAIDGLSVLVVEALSGLPQSGNIYLFHNRSGNKVKALLWDKNGFILHYKRLERGRFKFQKNTETTSCEISAEQLGWLFAGLDFILMDEFSELNFENYY